MERKEIESNGKYLAALARADEKGYAVTAVVSNKAGELIGCEVTGYSHYHRAIVHHHVTIEDNALVCDCEAAFHHNYCMHRALVTRKLMERGAQAPSEQEAEQQRVDAAFDALTAAQAAQELTHECDRCHNQNAHIANAYLAHYFWWNLCDGCEAQLKERDMPMEPIIARNDTGPRLFRETPKAIEHLLIGGWDGVVNGRDERLLEAYDKSSHVLAERVREVM